MFLLLSPVFGLNNGLGLTPQMGWNSWNHFACNVNETIVQGAANSLKTSGLAALGYTYVNIDDCWAEKERNSEGLLVPDPIKFPNGINGLATYVHGLGLKLGIYSDAGLTTCQGYPGSLHHEVSDASQFAEWGVDYLKYDNCDNTGLPALQRYPPMRDALNATGHPIFYSICNWGQEAPWKWGPTTGNSWRTTQDIKDVWSSMLINFYDNAKHASSAGPGAWNDPDMLEVGNGGMSFQEYKSHFSLWSIVKAPLIIGCDLQTMDANTLSILSNADVIAINQDPLGKQANCIIGCDFSNYLSGASPNVFIGGLANGDYAVTVTNWGSNPLTVNIPLSNIGIVGQALVKELWDKTSVTTSSLNIVSLPKHGTKMYRITPSSIYD